MGFSVSALDKAVAEANRFLQAATAVKREAGTTKYPKDDPLYCGGMYCAAAKRASLDLSRALADLRRGYFQV